MKTAERFNGRVEDYERYRTRYPAVIVEVLQVRCGLRPEDIVADVGAGTGMLAELFLQAANTVLAIEPNAEMRAACARLGSRYPRLTVLNAAAENTGLADASVDLVSAGRAFHWFDREKALAEFQRILKPGGWVTLVASRRQREGSEQTLEFEAILMEHGTDYAQVRGGYRSFMGLKPYGDCETFDVTMPGEECLTLEAFLGQAQSLSIVPLPGDAKYEGMQQALRTFFARWSRDGVLHLPTACEIVGWRTPLGLNTR